MKEAAPIFLIEGMAEAALTTILQSKITVDSHTKLWQYIQDFKSKPGFIKKRGLAYVGIYTFENGQTVYCLPKYFHPYDPKNTEKNNRNQSDMIHHMKVIVDTIDKLRNENNAILKNEEEETPGDFFPFGTQENRVKINRLSIARWILKDYLNNGIYKETKTYTGKNVHGKTLWEKTIKNTQPFIYDDEVVYPDLINRHRYNDINNIISVLHQNIVIQCAEYMNVLNEFKNISLPEPEIVFDKKNMTQFIGLIQNKRLSMFLEREQQLMKAFEAWCSETRYYEMIKGTTAFHIVWEAVNDRIWGNDDQKDSDNPVYSFFEAPKDFYASGKSKIDTLHIVRSSDNEPPEIVAIFDSKYYVPKKENWQKNDIDGYPSNSDISKQVGYPRMKQEQYGKKSKVLYSNAFLLSKISDETIDNFHFPDQMKQQNWKHLISYFRFCHQGQLHRKQRFLPCSVDPY